MRPLATPVLVALALALVGCKSAAPDAKPDGKPDTKAPEKPSAAAAPHAAPDAAKKLTWADPPGWTKNPPKNAMRVAEYVVPKKGGDTEDAECVINTFGKGQGGGVDANVDRWVRQFDPATTSGLEKKVLEGTAVKTTLVELSGTYNGMAMPGAAAQQPKKNARMVAAIVEASEGTYFFKLVGGDATVKDAKDAFVAMVKSAKE